MIYRFPEPEILEHEHMVDESIRYMNGLDGDDDIIKSRRRDVYITGETRSNNVGYNIENIPETLICDCTILNRAILDGKFITDVSNTNYDYLFVKTSYIGMVMLQNPGGIKEITKSVLSKCVFIPKYSFVSYIGVWADSPEDCYNSKTYNYIGCTIIAHGEVDSLLQLGRFNTAVESRNDLSDTVTITNNFTDEIIGQYDCLPIPPPMFYCSEHAQRFGFDSSTFNLMQYDCMSLLGKNTFVTKMIKSRGSNWRYYDSNKNELIRPIGTPKPFILLFNHEINCVITNLHSMMPDFYKLLVGGVIFFYEYNFKYKERCNIEKLKSSFPTLPSTYIHSVCEDFRNAAKELFRKQFPFIFPNGVAVFYRIEDNEIDIKITLKTPKYGVKVLRYSTFVVDFLNELTSVSMMETSLLSKSTSDSKVGKEVSNIITDPILNFK